jgi:hypothetical protein
MERMMFRSTSQLALQAELHRCDLLEEAYRHQLAEGATHAGPERQHRSFVRRILPVRSET